MEELLIWSTSLAQVQVFVLFVAETIPGKPFRTGQTMDTGNARAEELDTSLTAPTAETGYARVCLPRDRPDCPSGGRPVRWLRLTKMRPIARLFPGV